MQVLYVKNFIRTETNKLQNILLENTDGRRVAQRLTFYSVIVAREKEFSKESIFHLYYSDFFDLSERVTITCMFVGINI